MGIIPSRNLEDQRREKDGIVYFDRGTVTGKNGRKYDRFAIQTHFVQRGESQKELVEKYVRPLYQEGDVLSFGAKVMCMCVESVKTRDEVKPGFWANFLWRFAGINHTGVGMHEPYKLQLVIDICGLPRVLLAVFCSAVRDCRLRENARFSASITNVTINSQLWNFLETGISSSFRFRKGFFHSPAQTFSAMEEATMPSPVKMIIGGEQVFTT